MNVAFQVHYVNSVDDVTHVFEETGAVYCKYPKDHPQANNMFRMLARWKVQDGKVMLLLQALETTWREAGSRIQDAYVASLNKMITE